jgi:hypothetical protein
VIETEHREIAFEQVRLESDLGADRPARHPEPPYFASAVARTPMGRMRDDASHKQQNRNDVRQQQRHRRSLQAKARQQQTIQHHIQRRGADQRQRHDARFLLNEQAGAQKHMRGVDQQAADQDMESAGPRRDISARPAAASASCDPSVTSM